MWQLEDLLGVVVVVALVVEVGRRAGRELLLLRAEHGVAHRRAHRAVKRVLTVDFFHFKVFL